MEFRLPTGVLRNTPLRTGIRVLADLEASRAEVALRMIERRFREAHEATNNHDFNLSPEAVRALAQDTKTIPGFGVFAAFMARVEESIPAPPEKTQIRNRGASVRRDRDYQFQR